MGKAKIPFEKEKNLPVKYEGILLEVGYRCDFLVDNRVIVECKAVKAVKEVTPLYHAQLLNYLKITNLQLGLLINFNVNKLLHGIKRIVNNYDANNFHYSYFSAPSAISAVKKQRNGDES